MNIFNVYVYTDEVVNFICGGYYILGIQRGKRHEMSPVYCLYRECYVGGGGSTGFKHRDTVYIII